MTPLHAAGWTPVFSLARLGERTGLKQLWLKDESRNPTASFKDRASALVVARAREIEAEVVITASTGNAGAALAGMAAAVGQKAVVLAPKTAPPAKVAQLLVFGATVVLVDGTYDDAFDLTLKASAGVRLVLPQHRLQPLHGGRQEDRGLRDLGVVANDARRVAPRDRRDAPSTRR